MVVLGSLVGFVTTLICILMVYLALQVVLGVVFFRKKRKALFPDNTPKPSVTVLIPAHNEEQVIASTLESVLAQTTKQDSVVVVVDNCSDNTEAICHHYGVRTLVRKDEKHKSKGYALDYGLTKIKDTVTDCIIIVDADCIVEENAVDTLAKTAIHLKRPIQAMYLIKNRSRIGLSVTQKISEFAFLIKNKLRPAGMRALIMPCHLTGSGMAFPWECLMNVNLANSELVEDMKLGVDYVRAGNGPFYEPLAKVSSYFPTDEKAIQSQRTRWEHGHVATMVRFTPGLLTAGFKTFSLLPILFCIDLAIPPLALLVIVSAVFFFLGGLYWLIASSVLPFISIFIAGVVFFSAIGLAWHSHGKHIIKLDELLTIPKYIMSKLGIYKKLFGKNEKDWVKTKR